MKLKVTVVEDHEIPGHDWLIVRTPDGALLWIRRGRSTFETGLGVVLAQAWEAGAKFRAGGRPPLDETPPPPPPGRSPHPYWATEWPPARVAS